jgi:hypothetical protein
MEYNNKLSVVTICARLVLFNLVVMFIIGYYIFSKY